MAAPGIEQRHRQPLVSLAPPDEQGAFPSVESGVQGYLRRMKHYPVFTPEQNVAALAALHRGADIHALNTLAAFTGSLAARPEAYSLLFATCPRLEMALAFGNFPLIAAWGKRYAKSYPDLAPFPLEEYFQDALVKHVPDAAKSYRPERGKSFNSWVSTMLMWRLEDVVESRTDALYSLPEGSQPKENSRRATHDPFRQPILNLDQPLRAASEDAMLTLAEVIEDPTANTEGEALAPFSNLEQLYRLARLTDQQEEVLTALLVKGEEVSELAARLQRTPRAIRARREKALAALHTLDQETLRGVLSGEVDLVVAGECAGCPLAASDNQAQTRG